MSKEVESQYQEYFKAYTSLVVEPNVLMALKHEKIKTLELLGSIDNNLSNHRYKEGKWTVKQLISHCIDTERILTYRALRFSRNDNTELAGYDEDHYTRYDNCENRALESIISEYSIVRDGTIALFQSFSDEMMQRKGIANGVELAVETIGLICVGHEIHHKNVLMERYLSNSF